MPRKRVCEPVNQKLLVDISRHLLFQPLIISGRGQAVSHDDVKGLQLFRQPPPRDKFLVVVLFMDASPKTAGVLGPSFIFVKRPIGQGSGGFHPGGSHRLDLFSDLCLVVRTAIEPGPLFRHLGKHGDMRHMVLQND